MGSFTNEDILGLHVDSELCCKDCVNDNELENLDTESNIITVDTLSGDVFFFCDRCKKRI